MLNLIKKIFGTKNDRDLKRLWPIVRQVNELEETIQKLTDEELRAKSDEFRRRVQEGSAATRAEVEQVREEVRKAPIDAEGDEGQELRERLIKMEKDLYLAEGDVLNEILPEAFACVREASRRTIGLRHYDVQILGGIVLHQGKISEMKTGEGKTLVATLALYLNSLNGRGAHLVTVNDYLARRDVQWMGPIFHALGVSLASIVHEASFVFDPTFVVKDYRMINLRPVERKDAYNADITYGTNHEFGFDYLRDNGKFSLEEYVLRELTFAIVDEVDNILIDEARTPLIISGQSEESTDKYYSIDRIVPRLTRGAVIQGDVRQEERAAIDAQGDYTVDEKSKNVSMTEQGVSKVERMLKIHNLYDPAHVDTLHHVQQALKAHVIFKRDVDYIVKDGAVIIVDEFTGRLMPGRRWSDGLHQAVEAKEGVRIERENQTLATITIQNYFRMYRKLGGMTGTADTEAPEFKKIYNLDVLVAPPNKINQRVDHPDVVYKSEREKFNAVVDQIVECHERGQPVLVGTISVEKSQHLARLLESKGVRHNVLNAVNHEAEANIIAQAGRLGQVTIATNMAGRGTDILLGGNAEFLARADMENEWVRNSASMPEGTQRYEEILANLRSKADREEQAVIAKFEPLLQPLRDAHAHADEELGQAERPNLEASFWYARAQYEAACDKLRAFSNPDDREACVASLDALSGALIEFDRKTGPYFGEEGLKRFQAALAAFRTALESPDGDWQVARSDYDRVRRDYERAVGRGFTLSSDSSEETYRAARERFETAKHLSNETQAALDEAERPFREERNQVRETYESDRRKYTQAIDEVREQMEKAPDEIRERYEVILEKYKAICATEREHVGTAGGLYIIGTERHESRRIDNQLRGRAGRQGDPGASRFFLSLEDDLLRIFGADKIQGLMTRLGMEEGEPIEHGLISRAIANAQGKVEARNFDIRKHLIEYDDVMNKQREVIYTKRREVLAGENLTDHVHVMIDSLIGGIIDRFAQADKAPEEWDWQGLDDALFHQFNIRLKMSDSDRAEMTPAKLEEILQNATRSFYQQREQNFTSPFMRYVEKQILLQTIDILWKEHLQHMDHLKEGISLRGYGQRNPLQEYQKEGFTMFEEMIGRIEEESVQKLFTVQVVRQDEMQKQAEQAAQRSVTESGGGDAPRPVNRPIARPPATAAQRPEQRVVGRNDPCPCGSGKKYKKCHGA